MANSKITTKEKLLWNKAIKKAVNEMKKFDGFLKEEDSEYMANYIYEDLSYKNIDKNNKHGK